MCINNIAIVIVMITILAVRIITIIVNLVPNRTDPSRRLCFCRLRAMTLIGVMRSIRSSFPCRLSYPLLTHRCSSLVVVFLLLLLCCVLSGCCLALGCTPSCITTQMLHELRPFSARSTIYYTILYTIYYTILYYTILYYTILYYTLIYYTILYYTILYYTILYYTSSRILGV